MSGLTDIPAIAQMAERGPRFVCYRKAIRNGKPTKPPLRTNGQYADSTKAATWATLDACLKAVPRAKAHGVGFVLASERDAQAGQQPIGGIDLDGCRDPDTSEIEDWAWKLITEVNSYTEISPSGTGVKIFAYVDPVPSLTANKLVIKPANGHGKAQQVEVFVTERFFALTGQHLDGTPDEITDATEAFERLAAKIAKGTGSKGRKTAPFAGIDGSEPSADTMRLIERNPRLAKLWRGEKDEGDTTASGLDWSLAIALGKAGVAQDEIARVLSHYPHGQIGSGKLRGRQTERRLGTLVNEARKVREEKAWAGEETDDRPLIRYCGGELHLNALDAAKALAETTRKRPFTGVYRRGNMLVRPTRIQEDAELQRAKVKRAAGTLAIVEAETDYLIFALTRHVRWEKFDRRSDKWVSCNAPPDVVKAVAAAKDVLGHIPRLTGIIEAPTIRSDGSILDQPGYDEKTGLLFDPGECEFAPIPEEPTKKQAKDALKLLMQLLVEFEFVDEASKSTILSLFITTLIRKAMRAAPMHGIDAPIMASGKTLLATCASYLATGRAPAMMSQAEDPADERKRLLALLIEGPTIAVIDNIERPLKSDALCSILTEPLFKDRLLGATKTVSAPTNATFVATGNNLGIEGDLCTRSILSTLDPKCERPEERRFKLNLHEYVPDHRHELVTAALTIVRAYLTADQPLKGKLTNFARFEDWSRLVREPLVWLGMTDPYVTRDRIRQKNNDGIRLGMLLQAWHENYPGQSATAADAIRLATRDARPGEPDSDTERRHRLAAAMREVATKGNLIDSRALGNFIASRERRFESGLRFENTGESHHAKLWRVRTREEIGELSELGEFLGHYRAENVCDGTSIGGAGKNSPDSPNSPPPGADEEPEGFDL